MSDLGLHCCRDLIIMLVKRESLFSCFIIEAGSMDKSKKLSICSDCKKDMKQNYIVEFHIVHGGNILRLSTCP